MPLSHRREHLVDTAVKLFAEHGFHATGIDKLLEEAGVSKKTLYRHFRSKEDLILAALKKYEMIFLHDFIREVEKKADNPVNRIYAVFDVAGDWFQSKKFFGCMFINAIAEYSNRKGPVREVCKEYKALMRDYIRTLCREAGLSDPDHLSERLAMLLEGATVTAQVSQDLHAADVAKATAKILVEQAGGKT